MEERRFGERNGALEVGGGGGQVAEGEKEELELQARCLDLTSFQLRDLSEIEIPEDLVELDLNANRLSKLDQRIAHLSQLQKLSLRQNLFDDEGIEPISRWNALAGLIVKVPSTFSFLTIRFYLKMPVILYLGSWCISFCSQVLTSVYRYLAWNWKQSDFFDFNHKYNP